MISQKDANALELLRLAFQDCQRPEFFTDHQHCWECYENNQTFTARTPDNIAIDDLGGCGWDAVCLMTSEGFRYYLAGFARLALENTSEGCGTFLRHLASESLSDLRVKICSPAQRKAVAAFIAYLIETQVEQLEDDLSTDDALRAWEVWNIPSR